MPRKEPLSELLSLVLVAFADEFEQRLSQAGHAELSLPLGANVLRFLNGDGVRVGTLAKRSHVSKQAISQQVAYLEQLGYVKMASDPNDGRAKVVRLTSRGRHARAIAAPLFAHIERTWSRRLGRGEMEALRASLETVATRLGVEED
jgi:DNA-binding MarR family transcriptional regulator